MMKTRLSPISLLAILLLPFPPATLSAQVIEEDLPQVHVTGSAQQETEPDRMVWNIALRNEGKELDSVARFHSELTQRVLDILNGAGIEEEDRSTSRVQFGENWDYRDRERVRTGYFAATSMRFDTGDLDRYLDLWRAFSKIPEASVNQVQFVVEDSRMLREEVRLNALRDARRQAGEIAAVLEMEVGKPLLVDATFSEGGGPGPVARAFSVAESADSRGAAPPVGRITVRAEVRAVFELEEYSIRVHDAGDHADEEAGEASGNGRPAGKPSGGTP